MSFFSRLKSSVASAIPSMGAFVSYGGQTRRDAARHDTNEMEGWRPSLGFSGSTPFGDWETITGRARDLDANNGWVNGGLDRRVEAVIGGRIALNAQPVYKLLKRDYKWRREWAADVQARFKVHTTDINRRCDARQRMTFGTMAKVAYLTYVRDGEAAYEIKYLKRGLANPTAFMLIEPERISMPNDRAAIESDRLRQGIAYDENGAPIGYYIRSRQPGDMSANMDLNRWNYVPRFTATGSYRFVHVFSPRRAEQNRGISKLAEIMVPAKMLDRYDRAEVNAALKSALFSLFIKAPGTTDDVEAALAPGASSSSKDWIDDYLDFREKHPFRHEGAAVGHLGIGEDIVVPNPSHPNSNYPEFIKAILQKMAASMGLSYPQISQDFAGINYSSARVLLNEVWRGFLEDRHFFTQNFLTPFYAAWLEWEVALGAVKVPGGPSSFITNRTAICMCEWIGPGRGTVDPIKEANANNLDVAAGRKSNAQIVMEDGREIDDVMAEQSYEIEKRKEFNLGPANFNVKAEGSANSESDGAGSEEYRDGDGVAQEDKKRRGNQEDDA
jgi:lambda family phage portal protein